MVPITETVRPAPFYDVDGNGAMSALDVVRVINALSQRSSAEPESNDAALLSLLDDR